MKKGIIICILAIAIILQSPVAMAAEPPFQVIIPLEYDEIKEINGDLFIVGGDALCNLYDFSGELILGNKKNIEFARGWIKVQTDDGWGVYSRDGKEIVPSMYTVVSVSDAGTCMAMVGDQFIRPGTWFGERYLYDLISGKIVENLGYGSEFVFGELASDVNLSGYPNGIYTNTIDGIMSIYASDGTLISDKYQAISAVSGDIVYVQNSEGKMGGIDWQGNVIVPFSYNWSPLQSRYDYPLMILAKNYDESDPFGTSTWYDAYNRGGELIVGQQGRLHYCCDGKIIIGFDDGQNYVYSERGRLIASEHNTSFIGIFDGDYICAFKLDKPYIINSNGETVLGPGVFDTYTFNYTANSPSRQIFRDNDAHIVVSKDGKYGVITLPDYIPQASWWAQDATAEAVERNLVPEDIQNYWRDNCTREDFCHMLVLAIEETADQSIGKLLTNKATATFTDCDNADVLAAAALGIVNGVGNSRFAPEFFITRQEAAMILARTAKLLEIENTGESLTFSDANAFADWAVEGINMVSTIVCGQKDERLMCGVSNDRFDPEGNFTIEQSIMTLLHLTKAKTSECSDQ